jgi:uncharacterized pyridoxamine 5'-phosphate oxidase family protein
MLIKLCKVESVTEIRTNTVSGKIQCCDSIFLTNYQVLGTPFLPVLYGICTVYAVLYLKLLSIEMDCLAQNPKKRSTHRDSSYL